MWTPELMDTHKKKVMCKISAEYVKACRRKVRKTAEFISNNLSSKGPLLLQNLTQNNDTRTWSEVYKKKLYTKFQLKYQSMCEKSAENCVFPVF